MAPSQQQTFRLYLLRHAQAGWAEPGERDFDRRLTEEGKAEAALIGKSAAENDYRPEFVISSAATRCRETTRIFLHSFGGAIAASYLDEMYNAQAETYLNLALARDEVSSLMLVGHNPTMEAVAEALLGRDILEASLPHGFPTAGLAVLDCASSDKAKRDSWRLIDFLTL